jgi:hypothetical protein
MAQPRKTAKAPADPALAQRRQQLNEISTILVALKAKIERQRKDRADQLKVLESVSHGLYEEVDKLAKKSPVDQVTDLMLEQVNEVIRDTKALIMDDPYVQRQKEFVPAGENPENRDVLLVLRLLRQGLVRFKSTMSDLEQQENQFMGEARTIREALEMYVDDGRKRPAVMHFNQPLGKRSKLWFTGPQDSFDFARLDELVLAEYFQVEA